MSGNNGKLFYLPIPLLLFCGLQPVLFWTLSWPRYATVFVSLGWLFYRCNQVLSTPVEDLVHLLGLEVPPAPKLVLVDLTSDSVSLYWKAPDNKYAVNKNIVRVNGITRKYIALNEAARDRIHTRQATAQKTDTAAVADLPSHQTAITIENLPASAHYSIRVTAVNSSNFQATSNVLRVKSLEAADEIPHQTSRRQSSDGELSKSPRVVPIKGFLDQLSLNAAPPPPMTREPSANIITTRRTSHRRSSPGPHTENNRRRISGAEAPDESIQELTARLDALRREVQEVEKQDVEEEEEFESRKTALLEEKESLRIQLKEKEDGSRKIKGTVTNLERANAAAQSKRNAQEKLLQQKKQERQKMQEDMARWTTEMAVMEVDCRQIRKQIVEAKANYAEQVEKLRQEQLPDLDAIKLQENRLKEQRREVDELEEQKQELETAPIDTITAAQSDTGVDEDLEWSRRYNRLKERLGRASTDAQQALIHLQQTQFRFQMIDRRNSHTSYYPPPGQAESNTTPPNDLQPPSSQPGPSRSSTAVNESPFTSFGAISRFQARPAFEPPRTSSPFFQNRTLTAPLPGRDFDGLSPSDVEGLTGGALASPGASGLLPSNLLGDEADEDPIPHPSNFLPGLGALPGSDAADDASHPLRGPVSPVSIESGSRRGDFFFGGSPHTSNANLADGDDKRSLHSIGERKRSRLFGDIFGGRSRGKTHSTDSPSLGSLKASESQSLPKAVEWSENGAARPQSQKGTSVLNSFGLGRRGAPPQTRLGNASDLSISGPINGRAFGWNDQASSTTNLHNPWSRPGLSEHFHSRPTSVYSETQLPRPGEDGTALGWSGSDALGRSSSTRTGHLPNNPWMRSSRRPSVAAAGDSTTQLSGSSISEEEEDFDDTEARSPPQAPIGTRPKLKDSQLNPAAGVFTMFKSSRGDKDGARSKRKEKPKPLDDASTHLGKGEGQKEVAPSIDGSVEDAASTHTGDSVPSTPGPSSARSESFMRKLTRKGSTTSKFNLSLSSSREGKSSGSFFRRGGGTTPGLESNASADDDAALGRSVESVTSSPALGGSGFESVKEKRSSAFSLSSFKKRKGKGEAAPSISETSVSNASVDDEDRRESLDA